VHGTVRALAEIDPSIEELACFDSIDRLESVLIAVPQVRWRCCSADGQASSRPL
jgi:hypothetical protein